jgi:hypothetical protein
MIFNFKEYGYGEQIKEDGVRVACSMCGRRENKFFSKIWKDRDQLKDLRVNGVREANGS